MIFSATATGPVTILARNDRNPYIYAIGVDLTPLDIYHVCTVFIWFVHSKM